MPGGLRLVTPPNSDKYAQESTRQFDEAYGKSTLQILCIERSFMHWVNFQVVEMIWENDSEIKSKRDSESGMNTV